jgi:hypothetical protein
MSGPSFEEFQSNILDSLDKRGILKEIKLKLKTEMLKKKITDDSSSKVSEFN